MTKRKIKKHVTKRKNSMKGTKKVKKIRVTRKKLHGGDTSKEYKAKILFRRTLNDIISQITTQNTSRNKIKEGINLLIHFFNNNPLINTLIPVSIAGKYVDKDTSKIKISDMVSPITFMLDSFSGLETVTDKDIVRILNAYFINGGNFNNLSSRFEDTPFKHEVDKQRVNNIRILLNSENKFHIIEDGLDEATKTKLAALIPNEQQVTTLQPIEEQPHTIVEQNHQVEEQPVSLTLPSPLPSNNDVGYDRSVVPEFWKPIFENGEELIQIRESFMSMYEKDRYTSDVSKKFEICDLLEKLFPAYLTKYTLAFKESPKTLVNVNILNCFITLFYGMILYKLYETKQDYLFIFKGGRALQLSLVDIADIGQYFSEDTDILIIPNPFGQSNYDLEKMQNFSEHIAYLIKWIIPQEINVVVSLSTNPKNTNKDITKLLYNDNKLFKAISDIGFGEINESVKKFFDNYLYSPIYVDHFEIIALFITPTIDDMLAEKLFYYSKYLKFKKILDKNEPIMDSKYSNLTKEDCDYLLFKFKRAIVKLVDAIVKRDYTEVVDFERTNTSRLILRGFIGNFEDYTNDEKEDTIISIFP